MEDEWGGGTIDNTCPNCGLFVKSPKQYYVKSLPVAPGVIPYFWPVKCVASGYCKRCKEKVELSVQFI